MARLLAMGVLDLNQGLLPREVSARTPELTSRQ